MPDCDFRIEAPLIVSKGDRVSIRIVPPVVHPCGTRWEVDGKPATGEDNPPGIRVTQVAAGSMSLVVERERGQIEITATMECPGQCGPTTKTRTIRVEGERSNVGEEVLKTIGLVVTVPLGLISLILILLTLGRSEEAKEMARKVWSGLPRWLRRLLR